MTKTYTWSNARPAEGDDINDGASEIRRLSIDVQERMQTDHHWPSTNADACGEHEAVTLREQSADPTNATDKAFIYSKDDGGTTKVYSMDSAGTVTLLSVPSTLGDGTTAVTIDGTSVTIKIGGASAFSVDASSDIEMVGSLGVATGETITHNGTPCMGYMTDGTPLYCKVLTGTLSDGNYNCIMAHGLTSPVANKSILHITPHIPHHTSAQFYQTSEWTGPSIDFTPKYTMYDDTNVTVYRGGTTGTYTIYVSIIYK